MGKGSNGDGLDYYRWLSDLRERTRREAEQDTPTDYILSIRGCLADCPAFLEATLLRLHFLLQRDPNNEDLKLAHQFLAYAFKDVVKAREWARKL